MLRTAMPSKKRNRVTVKARERSAGVSPVGEEIVRGLKQIRDALASGEPMEKRFTVRPVSIGHRPPRAPRDQ
jgi:hypothetical protein